MHFKNTIHSLMLMIIAAGLIAFSPGPASFELENKLDSHLEVNFDSDPYSLIDAVNALRAKNGLAPYLINPILMMVAQAHAQYMSIAGVSHFGANGSLPWQRALSAGYPVGGDLTLGGFYSENIIAGNNKSAQDAVSAWQGDAPHLNTMLSPNLTEIGAGVVVVGDYVYYVIDCARPTSSGQPQPFTPSPGGGVPLAGTPPVVPLIINTIIPSTPLVDGKMFHIVRPGETLWLIAISYGLKVVDLRSMNNLSESNDIYPGEKLFIKQVPIPTLTSPTLTPTLQHSPTPSPSPSLIPSSSTSPNITPTQQVSSITTYIVLVAILAASLLVPVFLAIHRSKD